MLLLEAVKFLPAFNTGDKRFDGGEPYVRVSALALMCGRRGRSQSRLMEDHGLASACRQPRVAGGPLEPFPRGNFSSPAAANLGSPCARRLTPRSCKGAAKPRGYTTELLAFASDCDINTVQQGLYACCICRVREAANVEKILAFLPPPPNGQSKIDYYGDFLVIKYGVSEDWGRRIHEHHSIYKEFVENRKNISMAWLFPAPVPEGFEESDEPPRYPNRLRLQVEKQLRNVAIRAGWHFDYLDDAGELRIELVAVAPDQLELLLDAYETVGHNATASPGHLVETLAEELALARLTAEAARARADAARRAAADSLRSDNRATRAAVARAVRLRARIRARLALAEATFPLQPENWLHTYYHRR